MHNLSRKTIINRTSLNSTYFKGQDYYGQSKVREVRTTADRDYFLANVYGGNKYEVSVAFDSMGDVVQTSCNCKAYQAYPGDCKHVVALLLFIKDIKDKEEKTREKKKTEGNIKNILLRYRDMEDREKTPINLEINYKLEDEGHSIDLRMGEDRLYVVRSIANILSKINNKEIIEFGKNFTYNPNIHCFKEEDREIVEFLTILYENYEDNQDNYYRSRYNTTFSGKNINLTPKSLEKFLDLMVGKALNASIWGKEFKDIRVIEERIDLNFGIRQEGKDLIMELRDEEAFAPLNDEGRYFFYKDKIYKIPREQALSIMPILDEIVNKDLMVVRINEEDKEVFVSEILLNVKKNSNLIIDKEVEESIYDRNLESNIYFDRKGEVIFGKLEFTYGEVTINPFSSSKNKGNDKQQILLRDMEKESKIMNLLEMGDFKVENGGFIQTYVKAEEYNTYNPNLSVAEI